jgi:hypothetical protein
MSMPWPRVASRSTAPQYDFALVVSFILYSHPAIPAIL